MSARLPYGEGEPDSGAVGRVLEPLAVRMRPQALDDLVGQEHLLRPGSPLRTLVEGDAPMSVVLWGPPGTGKTTIAHIISRATRRRFVELSALTAGVKDVRAVIEEAQRLRDDRGVATVLFLDEAQRFTRVQQESLLHAVENRIVALVAATTENPSFALVPALSSRSLLITLRPLDEEAVRTLIQRAVQDERGLAGLVELEPAAEDFLVQSAMGDARWALTALEAAAGVAASTNTLVITVAMAEAAAGRKAVRYDADGDNHYDVVSAFIKSLRGSDPDAALHYLARMLEAGEDPRFIARRLMVHASEDVGLADPSALTAAVNAAQVVQLVGLPEARLALAQAALHIATSPKSNAVMVAINEAAADVRAGRVGEVPSHLRDAHYSGAQRLGHGKGYRYPHSDERGVVEQQYAPAEVQGQVYYRPTGRGAEAALRERLERVLQVVRGKRN